MLKNFIFAAICFLAAGAADAQTAPAKPSATPTPAVSPELKKANDRTAARVKDPAPEPYDKADVKAMSGLCVSLDTESGLIVMEMFPETAPETVRNFLNLAAAGWLDNTTFNRVVPNFVIQGGSLATSGKWDGPTSRRANRTIPDEPNSILHEKGIVSMARTDEPNSATTDFFILLMKADNLDGKFAAFGRVTKGMDVAETINKMPVTGDKPEKPVHIKKATVSACGPIS